MRCMRAPSPATIMKRLALVLAAFLILAVPATAATPKQQVKAQKVTIAKLKAQLAKTKRDNAATIKSLTGQVATLTTQNTTLTGEASATAILNSGKDGTIAFLQSQNATLAAQVSAQAAGGLAATLAGSPTDLWNAIAAIYPLMPSSSLCGYDKSFYTSGNYTSYSFTRYVC